MFAIDFRITYLGIVSLFHVHTFLQLLVATNAKIRSYNMRSKPSLLLTANPLQNYPFCPTNPCLKCQMSLYFHMLKLRLSSLIGRSYPVVRGRARQSAQCSASGQLIVHSFETAVMMTSESASHTEIP